MTGSSDQGLKVDIGDPFLHFCARQLAHTDRVHIQSAFGKNRLALFHE